MQRAAIDVRIGQGGIYAAVEVTSAGLIAIGALVSGILLSTALLVQVAVRSGSRRIEGDEPGT